LKNDGGSNDGPALAKGVLNLELVDARVGVEELPAGQSGQMEMARSTLVS
jgi:hypothetical protein